MTNTPELDRLMNNHNQFLLRIFQGDTPGAKWVGKIFRVLHVYDDLIDKDRALTKEEIHQTFWTALVDLPSDPFFTKHQGVLLPILINSIVNWKVANDIEAQEEPTKRALGVAWILRGAYIDLLSMALVLERGPVYAVGVGQLLRDWAHSETFEVYLDNLANEKAANHV